MRQVSDELAHRTANPLRPNRWIKSSQNGSLNAGPGMQTPQSAMTLSEEVIQLRKQVKDLTKENKRLKETNDFLEEASWLSIVRY